MKLALLFSGGGALGAVQVGFLEGLARRGIEPDFVVGTSVGALNGAVFAASPDMQGVERLKAVWQAQYVREILGGQTLSALWRAATGRNHLFNGKRLPAFLREHLGDLRFEDLAIPLLVTARDLESGRQATINSGPLIPALPASSALPGVFPPVFINGREYVDGGVVSHCGVETAYENGATDMMVLHCPHFLQTHGYGPLRPLTRAAISALNRLCQYELEKFGKLGNVFILEPPTADMSAYNSNHPNHQDGTAKLIEDSAGWAEDYFSGPEGTRLMGVIHARDEERKSQIRRTTA
ncbi:MAG: hypothetical protein FJ312_10210 [SAR202 cluster bacterium]|nr:hypothetical protein [SAR202 cluster bacterium]